MKRAGAFFVLFAVGLGVLAWFIASNQSWLVDRDFFTYWGGGRGLMDGMNLYAESDWKFIHERYGSTWLENSVFIYAPPTAIIFAMLGALPISIASVVWVWGSGIFVALSVGLVVRDVEPARLKKVIVFWALGVAAALPVILTLVLGQASALVLILIVLAGILWDRARWVEGGIILGLTVVKPQPVILLVTVMAFWLMLKRRLDGLVALAAMGVLSIVVTLGLFPDFLSDWSTVASGKVGGVMARMPTIWGIVLDQFGDSAPAMLAALFLVALCVGVNLLVVNRWKDKGSLDVIAVTVCFSCLVTPYLWNYDQILLLIPMFVALTKITRRGTSGWGVTLLPLAFAALEFVLLLIASARLKDTLSVAVPILLIGLMWYAERYPAAVTHAMSQNAESVSKSNEPIVMG